VWYVLDFEASSLSEESYPIEVSWGNLDGICAEYLINPDSVPGWTDWNDESEKVHNLSRSYCVSNGLDVEVVAAKLVSDLRGKTVYVDGGSHDVRWKNRLLKAAGYSQNEVQLTDFMMCVAKRLFAMGCKYPSIEYSKQLKQFEKLHPREHRAAGDVQWLIAVYRHLEDQSADGAIG
jgi:hypothetical protein